MEQTINNPPSGVSRVGQVPWAPLEGSGAPLNRFVFDICYPIDPLTV